MKKPTPVIAPMQYYEKGQEVSTAKLDNRPIWRKVIEKAAEERKNNEEMNIVEKEEGVKQ